MKIIHIENLQKYYGAKLILDNLEMQLNHGETAALVGENGTGKSTLAKLILGDILPDAGTITLLPGAEMGYLPQEVTGDDDMTIQHYMEQATGSLDTLKTQMHDLEILMSSDLPDDKMAAVLMEYGSIQETFQLRGGYDLPSRMERVFEGLSINYLDSSRLLGSLSGGEKTRVALAGLLLRAPDLLILDEPTNHLDFAGITWLENYLQDYPGALLLITHDRVFIDRVARQILELSPLTHNLTVYHGSYEDYLAQRDAEYQKALEAYNAHYAETKQLERLMQMTDDGKNRNVTVTDGDKHIKQGKIARSNKTRTRNIRNTKQRLDDLSDDAPDNPRHTWTVRFDFAPVDLTSMQPLYFDNISKCYGERQLFEGLSGRVQKGDRIVLVAPNGTGKSTLLRIFMGFETADSGTYHIAPGATVGYLDQQGETLNPEITVLEAIREVMPGSRNEIQTHIHRSGLFADAHLLDKQVSELSLGQSRKLMLARLIASRANFLLMDEPTNHLDLMSLEVLETALCNFPGAILAASHDRRFIERVATKIWYLEETQLRITTPDEL
ncbi:MAG: ABC-F family ATP-binding cassette domain-containing protein [Aggregatilineales bacterium]